MTDQMIEVRTDDGALLAPTGRLDQHPAAVYLAGLKPNSRRVMRHALDSIAAHLGFDDALATPWGTMRFQHAREVKTWLAESYAPATGNRALSALRGTLKAARMLRQLSIQDYLDIEEALRRGIEGEPLPPGRALTQGEVMALLAACANDKTAVGARDAALLAVGGGCGLRRAEIVGLDLADYSQEARELKVRHAKKGRERMAYPSEGTTQYLDDWLAIRGNKAGALFWPGLPSGYVRPGQLTPQTVYDVLKKRAEEAGIEDVSPHDLRRTFITTLLEMGKDLAIVADLAGHKDPKTTKRYDRRGEEEKRKAVEALHIPYLGRGDKPATLGI